MPPSLTKLSAADLVQALAAGAPVTETTGTGLTLLHIFIDSPQAVAALLERGANTNARTYMMLQAPLHLATNVEVAAMLLEAGAYVDARDGHGQTALHLAVGHHANPAMTRLLLQWGADPSIEDYNEQQPLHLAKTKGLADLLLDAGADPLATDRYGFSPCNAYRRPAEVNQHIRWRMSKQKAEDENMLLEAATARAVCEQRPRMRL